MNDSVLMYDLVWKSHTACLALYKSEFFHPKSGIFKRGAFEISVTVEEDQITYEGLNLDGEVESRIIVHKHRGVLY